MRNKLLSISRKLEKTQNNQQSQAGTSKQKQKPGRFSLCESAASAGLRRLSSPLSELDRSVYITGRSACVSAIANNTRNHNQLA